MSKEVSDDESCPVDGPGFLLIINFKEDREGSENDTRRLVKFFGQELGFHIRMAVEDMNYAEFTDFITSVRESLDETYYCFVCVVMGHGNEEGILTKDGARFPIQKIMSMFNDTNMTHFKGKPKWFIINACRGQKDIQNTPSTLKRDANNDTTSAMENLAIEQADTVVFYSTVQGYIAYRDPETGALFIQMCMDVFEERYMNNDIDTMMRIVNRKLQRYFDQVADNKIHQVAEKTTRMTRKLYLVKYTSVEVFPAILKVVHVFLFRTLYKSIYYMYRDKYIALVRDKMEKWKCMSLDSNMVELQTLELGDGPVDITKLVENEMGDSMFVLLKKNSIQFFSVSFTGMMTVKTTVIFPTLLTSICAISSTSVIGFPQENPMRPCIVTDDGQKIFSKHVIPHPKDKGKFSRLLTQSKWFNGAQIIVMYFAGNSAVQIYNYKSGTYVVVNHEYLQHITCMCGGPNDRVLMLRQSVGTNDTIIEFEITSNGIKLYIDDIPPTGIPCPNTICWYQEQVIMPQDYKSKKATRNRTWHLVPRKN